LDPDPTFGGLIAFVNLIWPRFDHFIWPRLKPHNPCF
jgi:hypothetical protein